MLVIDGVKLKTTPVTMLMLDCGDMIPAYPGHTIQIGDAIECPDECEYGDRTETHVADLVRTSLVG